MKEIRLLKNEYFKTTVFSILSFGIIYLIGLSLSTLTNMHINDNIFLISILSLMFALFSVCGCGTEYNKEFKICVPKNIDFNIQPCNLSIIISSLIAILMFT